MSNFSVEAKIEENETTMLAFQTQVNTETNFYFKFLFYWVGKRLTGVTRPAP
jgi:hypothetical protein